MTRVPERRPGFRAQQIAHFRLADPRHFWWQTQTEFFRATECALFEDAPLEECPRVLEIGCGEGANLVNLFARGRTLSRLVVGIDFCYDKVHFASGQFPGARFLCADAARLPLASDAFDLVICRDVLHHVEAPQEVLSEMHRVCAPRGWVIVIEPNGRNPLMHLFGRLIPAERGMLESSPAFVVTAVSRYFASPRVVMKQPLPLFRAVFHYRYGLPWLERVRPVAAVMGWLDRSSGRMLAADRWAYIVALSQKP